MTEQESCVVTPKIGYTFDLKFDPKTTKDSKQSKWVGKSSDFTNPLLSHCLFEQKKKNVARHKKSVMTVTVAAPPYLPLFLSFVLLCSPRSNDAHIFFRRC